LAAASSYSALNTTLFPELATACAAITSSPPPLSPHSGIAALVRIFGTPAWEGGGGEKKLIQANAFRRGNISAAIMSHPTSAHFFSDGFQGRLGGFKTIASHK
jgi:metal-dependent amidase/aminoacylase/carboxypeptidase family protein